MPSPLAIRLLEWYARNARQLPWRGQSDPYAIWVSEIMLQQTRVETVIPYFQRWMARFPDIETLAKASQAEVLRYWEGLGYYSRARNLHKAAQIVLREHGGVLPHQVEALRRLPGIGPYTSAALASIAFGADIATLDGNIRRVLARLFDVSLPIRTRGGEKLLWDLAQANLPSRKASQYNQALMDLGATICTQHDPDCPHCPLSDICQANRLGNQTDRPVRASRPAIPHHVVASAVIQRNGFVLIAQRPQKGLLGGLWEFPGGKLQSGEDLQSCIQREIREELGVEITVGGSLGTYKHAYTHFRITLHAFQCKLSEGEPHLREHQAINWVPPEDLHNYPMGKIDRQIAKALVH